MRWQRRKRKTEITMNNTKIVSIVGIVCLLGLLVMVFRGAVWPNLSTIMEKRSIERQNQRATEAASEQLSFKEDLLYCYTLDQPYFLEEEKEWAREQSLESFTTYYKEEAGVEELCEFAMWKYDENIYVIPYGRPEQGIDVAYRELGPSLTNREGIRLEPIRLKSETWGTFPADSGMNEDSDPPFHLLIGNPVYSNGLTYRTFGFSECLSGAVPMDETYCAEEEGLLVIVNRKVSEQEIFLLRAMAIGFRDSHE